MSISVDEQFIQLAAVLRGRRRWRHLLAIGLGGLVLLTGALAIGVIATGYRGGESAAGMPLPIAVVLYGLGSLSFAWGCAHSSKRSFTWWLIVTLLAGAVMATVMMLGAALGGGSGGGDGSSSSSNEKKSATKQPRPELAARVADRELAEQILGAPVEGPSSVARIRRGKSIVTWSGPPADAPHRPLFSAQVVYEPGHEIEPPQVRRANTPSGAELLLVRGWSADWQVALHVRSSASLDHVEPILVQRVNDALVALDAALRR